MPIESEPIASAKAAEPEPWAEAWLAAIGTFTLYLIIAAELVFNLHTVEYDALTRALNGFYVIFQRFHLAAVGFVWNPLPSLLAIPILVFHNVWPPLLTDGFVSNIVSAAFGALGAFYLVRIMQNFGVPLYARIVFTVLYVVNPEILFYGANGMTDTSMLSCFLAALDGLLRYIDRENVGDLVSSSVWLAITFLIRYEAVPFALCIGVAWGIAMWLNKVPWSTIIGRLLILATPISFAGGVWLFFNATIMKNPLYFLNGPYSNNASIKAGGYDWWGLRVAAHSLSGTLHVVWLFVTSIFPPFIPALIIVLVLGIWRRMDAKALIIVASAVAVPLFQIDLMYHRESAVWTRFFMVAIPMGFVLLVFVASHIISGLGRRPVVTTAVSLVLGLILALGDFQNSQALATPVPGHGVYPAVNVLLGRPVVIVGGSAASGWHDALGEGYIERALFMYQEKYGEYFAIFNHAVPGSPVVNPFIARAFRSWMAQTRGGIAIIAWGFLNDLLRHERAYQIAPFIHQEIAEALATDHIVFVVSPAATIQSYGHFRVGILRFWQVTVHQAARFNNPDVHVIDVLSAEKHYLAATHQSITRFAATKFDPNTAGAALAGRLLYERIVNIPNLGYALGTGLGRLMRGDYTFTPGYWPSNAWSTIQQERQIALYINAHPEWKVLLDTFNYWAVVPFIKHPDQIIMTGDEDFQSILHNPRGRVDVIIDPAPITMAGDNLDAVNTVYPSMYYNDLPWTLLIKQFPGPIPTRVFEVLPTAP
jgi:hypothetical protein